MEILSKKVESFVLWATKSPIHWWLPVPFLTPLLNKPQFFLLFFISSGQDIFLWAVELEKISENGRGELPIAWEKNRFRVKLALWDIWQLRCFASLGCKATKVESFCTCVMKVCLDVKENAQYQMRAHAHTYSRRTLVTHLFYRGITGTKSPSGSYLHPIVWPCHLSSGLQVWN